MNMGDKRGLISVLGHALGGLETSALLVGSLLAVLMFLPAAWIVPWWQTDRLVLSHIQGSVWRGQVHIAWRTAQGTLSLPGLWSWQFTGEGLWRGELAVQIRHPALSAGQPMLVIWRLVAHESSPSAKLEIAAGGLTVPANVLMQLGAPWNTLQPAGELQATWSGWRITKAGRWLGQMQIEWHNAQTALSPIAPLGSYRCVFKTVDDLPERLSKTLSAQWICDTLSPDAPLTLTLSGQAAQGVWQMQGQAQADARYAAALQNVLRFIGLPINEDPNLRQIQYPARLPMAQPLPAGQP